jgi:hypothetical protein
MALPTQRGGQVVNLLRLAAEARLRTRGARSEQWRDVGVYDLVDGCAGWTARTLSSAINYVIPPLPPTPAALFPYFSLEFIPSSSPCFSHYCLTVSDDGPTPSHSFFYLDVICLRDSWI